jgi:signal transduction histidine kinase
MDINWFQVLRRSVQVLTLCIATTILTYLIWPEIPYRYQLVLVLSIGGVCWLAVEAGRLLMPRKYRYLTPYGEYGLPKDWRALTLLAAASSVTGFFFGKALGMWLLGNAVSLTPRDQMLALAVTIVANVGGIIYLRVNGAQVTLQARVVAAERDAAEARLMLLQSQLEPHMLFNTLANLRALIGTDPAAARHMMDRLDGFLRTSLNASRVSAHPLEGEFDLLRDYLELMSIRMGPRLNYVLRLPDELRALPVPPLLLQPLVENAIKHGLEPCVKGGRIKVSATRKGHALRLTVRDTGVGFDASQPIAMEHFVLTQMRERVASVYGARGRVKVQSQPGRGATIRITVPLPPEYVDPAAKTAST